jgi:uncharacterized protein (DUF427 family)
VADHITINKADGMWVVRAGGAILGESAHALELTEGHYPPVIYFPRDDLAMAFLDKSATHSSCPFKGEASYFSFSGEGGVIRDVGWSYETPKAGVEAIAGHIAFYTNKVAVEEV